MDQLSVKEPLLCQAECMVDFLFPSDFWDDECVSKKAGNIIHIIRSQAGKRAFAWSFPAYQMNQPGKHWRFWTKKNDIMHFLKSAAFQTLKEQGVMISNPQTCQTASLQGVSWVRKQSTKNRASGAYLRRQEKRRLAQKDKPDLKTAKSPPILKNEETSSTISSIWLSIPSHQSQESLAQIIVHPRPCLTRKNFPWAGEVNHFGFSVQKEGQALLALPDESQTPGLSWSTLDVGKL